MLLSFWDRSEDVVTRDEKEIGGGKWCMMQDGSCVASNLLRSHLSCSASKLDASTVRVTCVDHPSVTDRHIRSGAFHRDREVHLEVEREQKSETKSTIFLLSDL